MPVMTIREIQVGYDDRGSGEPTVVLIHGHPFNRTMWQEQVNFLESNYRVITPDLRGYGESTVVEGKVTLEEMARDIAALLDNLGINAVVLGGLSMGGQIVFEFYRLFPHRVKALLLAATFPQGESEEGKKARRAMAERLLATGMKEYADEALPKMIGPKTLAGKPGVAERVYRMMASTRPEGAAAALRGRAERHDYVDLLPRIEVPTLIVAGDGDAFTQLKDAELMQQKIGGSQLAIIQGTGHMPNMEKPDEFNALFLDFLHALA